MTGTQTTANLTVGLLVLGLVIVAIGVYVFRENRREVRGALKRVTFVNQVSHELKTPLTNIRMYAELLDMTLDETDEKSRSHLDVIVQESQRLSRLIGNVLTFGRGQRKKLAVHPTPHVVDDIIRKTSGQFAPSLNAKGIEVTLDLNAKETVVVDADALEQILGNLLANVEKYAASGKLVTITSARDGDNTLIQVKDQGPGIPKSAREKIFAPFFRISGALTEGVSGTGIGLAISRDLARRHGGDLTLVPCPKGATFELNLDTPPADTNE